MGVLRRETNPVLDGILTERHRLFGASALAVLGAGLELARPWPLTLAIDHAIEHRPLHGPMSSLAQLSPQGIVATAAMATAGLSALMAVVDYLVIRWTEQGAERIGARLRQMMFDHAVSLSLRYHDRTRSGELVSRLTTDVSRVLDAIVFTASDLLPDSALLIGMVVILMAIDPGLALLAMAAIPFLAYMAIGQRRLVRSAQSSAREEGGRLATTATDMLRNVRAVQAFGNERQCREAFAERNDSVLAAESHAVGVDARWSPRADLVLGVGSGTVLFVGAQRVLSGGMSTGTLLVVLAYLASMYAPVRALARLASTLAKAGASSARIREILDCDEEVTDQPWAIEAPPAVDVVRFEGVSFAYAPGQWVLRDFDLDVPRGSTVCLLGPSGVGKSTVLQLLLRLYDVDDGRITVDGIDIRDCTLASLRRRIGFVPQEPWLLDGTIADNIAFGVQGASRQAVLAAGELAFVDEFATRFPLGYDSPVGEGGNSLSGGQKRRIAIARAVCAAAPILVLDEPTSSLDRSSVEIVTETIEQLRGGRTTFIVTHDLRLARLADQVVTLNPLSPPTSAPCPGATAPAAGAAGPGVADSALLIRLKEVTTCRPRTHASRAL
jgi:ATP-binding cassette subfamily B protein